MPNTGFTLLALVIVFINRLSVRETFGGGRGHICRVRDRNRELLKGVCECLSCLLWSCLSVCRSVGLSSSTELNSFLSPSFFLVLCVGWAFILSWDSGEGDGRNWKRRIMASAAAAQTYAKSAQSCVILHQYSCSTSKKAGKRCVSGWVTTQSIPEEVHRLKRVCVGANFTPIRSFSVRKIQFFFMGTFPNVVYFQLLKECPNKCQTNFEQLETTLQTKEVLKKKFRFYRRKIRQFLSQSPKRKNVPTVVNGGENICSPRLKTLFVSPLNSYSHAHHIIRVFSCRHPSRNVASWVVCDALPLRVTATLLTLSTPASWLIQYEWTTHE